MLLRRIELPTPSLPMTCSTTELQQPKKASRLIATKVRCLQPLIYARLIPLMSHPKPAAKRDQLGAALKRNLSRRKAVKDEGAERGQQAKRQASGLTLRSALLREPRVAFIERGQQAEPAMSCDSTPHGEVSRPSRRQ